MQSKVRPTRRKLHIKLALSQAAVTLGAALVAEGAALGALTLTTRRPVSQTGWGLNAALVIIGAPLIGLALGAWASRRLVRRLERALEISHAWLRGNLSLRIADRTPDELGTLTEELDLLAAHLERDEQDLDELRERNARLTDQVRALAVVEERNRLARELHDSVKQHLFSLAMTASGFRTRLEALQGMATDASSELAEMMDEIETTAQAAQREMTRLIKDLRPSSLQDQGLAEALNAYTLLFGAREHLLIYLEVQGNDALLSHPVAEALYRVAQEALHNVARHARATRVDVHLRCIPELVALTIRDNGVGFDTERATSEAAAHRGLGLVNMQERVMDVGGRLTIESQIGCGTTVTAEVGLTQPLSPRSEIARLDKNRPNPTIENWPWLGQRLVIPVGQTWPWLPADQVHLRRPLVESTEGPMVVKRDAGFLGLKRSYTLRQAQGRLLQQTQNKTRAIGQRGASAVRVHRGRSGYEWEHQGTSWALRYIRGLNGRMVLTRNGQSLAAIQNQGRLLNTWSEIVYDGRGYRLAYAKGQTGRYVLADADGDELLTAEGEARLQRLQIELHRALPLQLLVMVAMRIVDEMSATRADVEATV